jgi:hypothetical protein
MRNTDATVASAAAVLGGEDLHLDSSTREAGGVAQSSTVLTLKPGAAVSVDLVLWRGAANASAEFDGWAKAQKSPRTQTENIPTAPDVAEQVTRGLRGLETGPFAVDTLTLPYDNPYHALLFAFSH